jgi:hypothetical protein
MCNWTKNIVQLLMLLLAFDACGQELLPARKNKQWGYIDTAGNWIVQPVFDLVSPMENKEFARVFAEGQIGLVSKKGQVVFKNDFKKMVLLNDSVLAFSNGNSWGLSKLDGNLLLTEEYDYFYNFGTTGLIEIQKGKSHGLCNQQGEIILPVIYEKTVLVNGDLQAISAQLDGQFQLFSQTGIALLSAQKRQIIEADTNFYVISENELIGAVDSTESTLVPLKYASYQNLGFYLSLWETKKEKHLYNSNLKRNIHKDAQEYFVYSPTRIRIKEDEKYGVITEKGATILPTIYQSIGTNGLHYKLINDMLFGLANTNGKILVPIAYNYVAYPQDSMIPVSAQNKWGLYFEDNGKIIDTIYDRLNILERQLKAGNQKGVAIIDIGPNGKIISKDVYERVYLFKIAGNAKYGFSSDTVKATSLSTPSFYFQDEKTGLWGLRNPKGELVIRAIFARVTHFSNGYTIGYINGGSSRAISIGQFQLGIANYMALIDDKNYKMMTPPHLIYIDVNDLTDTAMQIVRIMAGTNRFSTINKQTYKIKQYNATWMDPLNATGYTRIYVGGVLKNSYKEEPFKIGTVMSLARNYGFIVPTSKMSRNALSSEVVCKGGYWNYIDKNGDYLLDAKLIPEKDRFKEAFSFYKNTAVVIVNDKWGVIDGQGKYITTPNYDNITRIMGTDLLVLGKKEMAYGFADKFGNIIGQLDYDKIDEFSEGKAWVMKDQKWRLLSENGTLAENSAVIRFKQYKNGWAPIKTDDKYWGYWNGGETTWKIGKFQALGAFNDGLARYKQYGKYGYINDNGIKLLPPTFYAAGDFENGFAWAKNRKGKMAIINADMKVITSYKYRKIEKYDAAKQVKVKKRKLGLLDNKGKSLLNCRYKSIGELQEQRRIAQKRHTLVILNEEGKVIRKVKNIKRANSYSDGLCLVKRGRHYGYLDINGNWALPPKYRDATDFSSGVALVGGSNSRSIINRFGDTMTLKTLKARHAYKNGVTVASNRSNNLQYLADIYGNDESNSQYFKIKPFKSNDVTITVEAEKKLGLLHYSGIEMLPAVFTHINEPNGNVSKVLLNQKQAIINCTGQMLLEPGYFNVVNLISNKMVQINGFGTSYGYLRYDGTWMYKEF